VIPHRCQHREDFLVNAVELSGLLVGQVFAAPGGLDVRLSLGCFAFRIVEFANERGLIAALAPRFGDLCRCGARGPSSLVRERKFFLRWKELRDLENRHLLHPSPYSKLSNPDGFESCPYRLTFSLSHALALSKA